MSLRGRMPAALSPASNAGCRRGISSRTAWLLRKSVERRVQKSDWRQTGIALTVGLIVYVVMRFVVPHSIDNNIRSLIGGGVAFVASIVLTRFAKPTRR